MAVDYFLTMYGDVLFLDYESYRGSVMQAKMIKQIRAIKRFAKAYHIRNLDEAATLWVSCGCAAKWASQN